jgi:hypothetical protein
MEVLSKRIMAQVLEQIQHDGLMLRDRYDVDVAPLVDGPGLSVAQLHRRARAALVELGEAKWTFEDGAAHRLYQRPLLDQTRPDPVQVNGSVVSLVLNPALAPYFLKLAAEDTFYKFDGYLKLHSWYAMRFLEILSHYQDAGYWEVGVEEYRQLMDCAPELDAQGQPVLDKTRKPKMKFAQSADLIAHTIEAAQQELASTAYAFTYAVRQTLDPSKGRPRVSGFRFELVRRPGPSSEQKALRRRVKNVAQALFPGQGNPTA